MNSFMKMNLILFVLISWINAYADSGLVKIETTYQDVSSPEVSVKYSGQGFIVDYPLKSKVTGQTVTLKVVHTAAHLVFGGILTERQDNFRLFKSNTGEEIFALGMISDVIHDTATVVLCTQEAMDFFKKELINHNIEGYINLRGQAFTKGGGCVSDAGNNRVGKITENIEAFATYSGEPLAINPNNAGHGWLLSDKSIEHHQIFVNTKNDVDYLTTGDLYSVPNQIEKNNKKSVKVLSAEAVLTQLKPQVNKEYSDFAEVPREFSVPLSLNEGYSGSPIVTLDKDTKKLIVSGTYKSSTQSTANDSYSNLGWASPIEINLGLLKLFLNRYSETLDRWHTVPQAYLYLNNKSLVREMFLEQFNLFEGETENSLPSEPVKLGSGWIRSDTGDALWIRTDSGESISTTPRMAKQLNQYTFDGVNYHFDLVSAFVLDSKTEGYVVLPPVFSSMPFLTKYNCESCINLNSFNPNQIGYVFQREAGKLLEVLWKYFSGTQYDKSTFALRSYKSVNGSSNIKKMSVIYSKEVHRIKVELKWDGDSVVFYILRNNKFQFKNESGKWHQTSFASALETVTHLNTPLLLELGGLIYYNAELQDPKSFRVKFKNQKTQLFKVK